MVPSGLVVVVCRQHAEKWYVCASLGVQAQQRELTARHVKEMERELSRSFQLQKEQYEATIQRHLAFIDQVSSGAAATTAATAATTRASFPL